MAGYQTTPEQMRQAAAHVEQTNQTVQNQLSQLKQSVEAVAGAWKGQAAGSFQTLMVQWDQNAQKLNQALAGIGTQIQGSGQSYQQAEEQHQQSISAITRALG